jgi:pyruvate dehydrogenase E2 component (dihydrolipoamide acetyltransferase)
MVLLHGYSAAAIHYLPLIRRIRPLTRRIIAVDLPAHGLSDSPRAPLQGKALRSGLIEALDSLLIEPAVLFGNSMGGLGAIHYALARPERVAGLVLCSPAGAPMNETELVDFHASFRIRSHVDALDFTDRLLPRGASLRHPVAWSIRQKFNRPAMRALLESLRPSDCLRPDEFRSLQPPMLVIWGTQDHILPRYHVEFFRRHKPLHAHFEEPEGFSHSPYLENAPALTARLATFLADLEREPSTVRESGERSQPRRNLAG